MTNDEAEGSVGVAGVRDGAPVRAEEVDPDDPEWSDDFARGEAWLGHLQLHPGASGWKPYQD
jgi:hypothetical protein